MGETIRDMDIEREQKDKEKSILEKKVGFTDDTVVEYMNKLGLSKLSIKKNCDIFMHRLNKRHKNHKYIEN